MNGRVGFRYDAHRSDGDRPRTATVLLVSDSAVPIVLFVGAYDGANECVQVLVTPVPGRDWHAGSGRSVFSESALCELS